MSNTIKRMEKLFNYRNLSHGGNFCPSLLSMCFVSSVKGTINSVFNECIGDIEDMSWLSYKEKNDHQSDEFRQFFMRLAK